jgi:hypothetical protein
VESLFKKYENKSWDHIDITTKPKLLMRF